MNPLGYVCLYMLQLLTTLNAVKSPGRECAHLIRPDGHCTLGQSCQIINLLDCLGRLCCYPPVVNMNVLENAVPLLLPLMVTWYRVLAAREESAEINASFVVVRWPGLGSFAAVTGARSGTATPFDASIMLTLPMTRV